MPKGLSSAMSHPAPLLQLLIPVFFSHTNPLSAPRKSTYNFFTSSLAADIASLEIYITVLAPTRWMWSFCVPPTWVSMSQWGIAWSWKSKLVEECGNGRLTALTYHALAVLQSSGGRYCMSCWIEITMIIYCFLCILFWSLCRHQ